MEEAMAQVRGFYVFWLAVLAAMLSLGSAAQTTDPLAVIQQKLNSQFRISTITADRSNLVTAGDVIAIHKPGMVMYAVNSPMPPSNSYKNGRIGQGWGGFGKDLMIGMAAPGGATAADYPHRAFVPEEKCWVTGIQVQKDGVLFQVYSDPYDDIRYYANLKIPFPNKKVVPSAEDVQQLVTEVLSVVSAGDSQGGQGSLPASASYPGPASAPAPAAYGDIAPPPPPPASAPAISIGQSKAQVTAAFGEPVRKAVIGAKEIDVYKDMKVTFTSGRVSKVE
jgi:hypothetical protein